MNNPSKRTLIGSSALFILFGIALIAWPNQAKNAICLAAGVLLAALGLKKALAAVKDKTFLAPEGKAGAGIMLLLAGIFCAIRFKAFAFAVLPLLGAALGVDGFYKLRLALKDKSINVAVCKRNAIISAVIIAAGLFMLFYSNWENKGMIIAAGAFLALNGIYGGWLCFENKAPEGLPEPTKTE